MPIPDTFNMEDVVNGVLTELRYAPGRDVQIHLQSGIVQTASRLYRTLMQKYLWRDWYHVTPFTTDPATGNPVENLNLVISRYSDIYAVYKDKDERALPFAAAIVNPNAIRKPTVAVGTTSIFRILPAATYSCTLISRTYQDADFALDSDIPFYKDLLVLGTAYDLALKSGTNNELAAQLKQSFEMMVQTFRADEVEDQYSARPTDTPNVMTDWYVTP